MKAVGDEAYHGIIMVPERVAGIISDGFDKDLYYSEIVGGGEIKQPGYLLNPDELMARMAQLKNYFGMNSGIKFTKGHLEYARTHYVPDTGLNNSMSVMFRIISPKTEAKFLLAMNTLPV